MNKRAVKLLAYITEGSSVANVADALKNNVVKGVAKEVTSHASETVVMDSTNYGYDVYDTMDNGILKETRQ